MGILNWKTTKKHLRINKKQTVDYAGVGTRLVGKKPMGTTTRI